MILGVQLLVCSEGMRVDEIEPAGLAARAGLMVGDVIVTIDGVPVTQGRTRAPDPDCGVLIEVLRAGERLCFQLGGDGSNREALHYQRRERLVEHDKRRARYMAQIATDRTLPDLARRLAVFIAGECNLDDNLSASLPVESLAEHFHCGADDIKQARYELQVRGHLAIEGVGRSLRLRLLVKHEAARQDAAGVAGADSLAPHPGAPAVGRRSPLVPSEAAIGGRSPLPPGHFPPGEAPRPAAVCLRPSPAAIADGSARPPSQPTPDFAAAEAARIAAIEREEFIDSLVARQARSEPPFTVDYNLYFDQQYKSPFEER
ncbi:MAG TPA: PDZ domain-containing protein [Xanthobacteraceae bacterium]|jgi:hypothetical protein